MLGVTFFFTTTLALSGEVNGEQKRYTYEDVRFRIAGGDAFIARLWATRKVGQLLRNVRLHGERRELVEEIREQPALGRLLDTLLET